MPVIRVVLLLVLFVAAPPLEGQDKPFSRMDVFDLEYVQDPRISPDGQQVVYRRRSMDIMEDRRLSHVWLINADGSGHMKLTGGQATESSPRWSPDGTRVAFVSRDPTSGSEIFVHWVEENRTTRVTRLERSPGNLSWSPDGRYIAFSMHVPEPAPRLVAPPRRPDGARWAAPPRVETRLNHEADRTGILEYGYSQLFVVSADGGGARQVTSGDYHHSRTPAWSADGKQLIFSANRRDDWEHEHRDSELFSVDLETGEISQLTDRYGPNHSPVVSPDGRQIAYLGYEDRVQTYQITRLYVMDIDGSNDREIETGLDRSIDDLAWDARGRGLYIQYEDRGNTKIGHTTLRGQTSVVAHNLGGASAGGRPYGGGDFTVSRNGTIAMNQTRPYHPGELAIIRRGWDEPRMLTDLNGDLLGRRTMGEAREVWYTSSLDGRQIQGWVVTPPGYDPSRTYPLLVELHGGPINSYGDRFSAEVQLYAASGYIVFYPNYRGSTSYGEEFGNLLYHAFPGRGDYQDVMDGVDHLIEKGMTTDGQLFITGGSAGGTLTAWVIGKTHRFQAAAVQKPVMNWISKTLAADNYYAYADNRYPGWAWENPMEYWERSPISLVGDMETPTLVVVGERDLRTPTWEAKQLYNALKVRGVDAVYVVIPGAWHNTVNRPSQLIANVDHILAWFERYR